MSRADTSRAWHRTWLFQACLRTSNRRPRGAEQPGCVTHWSARATSGAWHRTCGWGSLLLRRAAREGTDRGRAGAPRGGGEPRPGLVRVGEWRQSAQEANVVARSAQDAAPATGVDARASPASRASTSTSRLARPPVFPHRALERVPQVSLLMPRSVGAAAFADIPYSSELPSRVTRSSRSTSRLVSSRIGSPGRSKMTTRRGGASGRTGGSLRGARTPARAACRGGRAR